MTLSRFESYMAPLMESYIIYRKASGRWSATYEQNLHLFDRHCSRQYPKAEVLTQEMVDGWCSQRATEKTTLAEQGSMSYRALSVICGTAGRPKSQGRSFREGNVRLIYPMHLLPLNWRTFSKPATACHPHPAFLRCSYERSQCQCSFGFCTAAGYGQTRRGCCMWAMWI